MATRMGAKALHLGNLVGTLEPGKRADLILVDISRLHNSPRFHRDTCTVYSQLVYASKSTDVRDVMVNGRWLMRDRQLTTLDEEDLLRQSNDCPSDRRLPDQREHSSFSWSPSGATEGESEVQVKVPRRSPTRAGCHPET
jgi:5-methylthioadenosine/S-adenosylhomocysteine deaminase